MSQTFSLSATYALSVHSGLVNPARCGVAGMRAGAGAGVVRAGDISDAKEQRAAEEDQQSLGCFGNACSRAVRRRFGREDGRTVRAA